jgi:sugar O-acyltransferase (sialic acid O-acetyltransferase NeuD family)
MDRLGANAYNDPGAMGAAAVVRPKVAVIGAGGHGSEVQAYLKDLLRHGWQGTLLGFADDAAPHGRHRNLDVIGTVESVCAQAGKTEGLHYFTAIGSNPARRAVVQRVAQLAAGLPAFTLIHPTAYLGEDIQIGEGTLLAPNVVITARVKIGSHCILNVKASISHDCEVGDFVNLNPGVTVCGNCRIGDAAYIGAGATVMNGISVGAGAIVGGGAMVTRDIPPHTTAVGVPARVIKHHEPTT